MGQYPLSVLVPREMNRILRHRLRNFCAGMKMTAERISDRVASDYPDVAERCSLVVAETIDLQRFTERMDLLFDALPSPSTLTLFELMVTARDRFVRDFPARSLELDGPEDDVVLEHGTWLQTALGELLANAGEAAGLDGLVRLSWRTAPAFAVSVMNAGDTIPPEIPVAPPRPFCTERSRHNGIGMAIAFRICTEMEATMNVEAREPGNTVVSITCRETMHE